MRSLLIAIALLAAACGSGNDTSASPSPFPTVPPVDSGDSADEDESASDDGGDTTGEANGNDGEAGDPNETDGGLPGGDETPDEGQDDGFILQLPTTPAEGTTAETDTDSTDGSGDDDTDDAQSSTQDETDPDPTAGPTSVPTPTPPPAPPTCAADAPIEPARSTSASLDWDGDGEDDSVQVYGLGQLDAPDWRVRVETASGSVLDSPLQVEDGSRANVSVIGGADVDGDATTDEAFVVVGAGAAASIVTIVNQSGCDIVPVTLNGAPISFPIGGSALNIGGLTCEDSDNNGVNNSFWAWVGTSADGENWLIDGVQFQLRGTELTQLDAKSFEASTSEPSFNYPFLTCGTISWI